MFTPPPSPLPVPRIVISDQSDGESNTERDGISRSCLSVSSDSSPVYCDQDEKRMQAAQAPGAQAVILDYERKKRSARRTRWAVLLVPAILILVALTSRRLESMLGSHLLWEGSNPGDGSIAESHPETEWRVGESAQSHDRTHHRHKRQTISLSNPAAPSDSALFSSSTSETATASETGSPTSTVPQTEQTIPSVPDSSNPPTLPTPFPQPFDTTGAVNNLTTQTCANFFVNMTQQLAFRSCRPFSLLEYFSDEFIESQNNLTLLNALIYGTCTTATDIDTCTSNMNWFSSSLSSQCSTELGQNHIMVKQTLLGLQSYSLLRTAACLVNQQSNTYCYASAAHSASPADLYYYQLPLGIGFPVRTTQPSCSTCAKSVLGLYAEALRSGDDSAAGLKETYGGAATQAESVCGTGFATVGIATTGASSARRTVWVDGGRLMVVVMTGVFALAVSVV